MTNVTAQVEPVATYPSGRVLARMGTTPDHNAIHRAVAFTLGESHDDLADRVITAYASGSVVALVLSGKMASGKDFLAECVSTELSRRGLPLATIHRTSDPIRAELDQAIAVVRASSGPAHAVTGLVESMGLPRQAAQHIVTYIYDDPGIVNAQDRTDANRHLLVYLADEGRRSVTPDYWVERTMLSMLNTIASGHTAILTGARYPNEILPAQALGMFVARIEVSPEVQRIRLSGRDGLAVRPEVTNNINECALDRYVGFNLVVGNDGAPEPTTEAIVADLTAHGRALA